MGRENWQEWQSEHARHINDARMQCTNSFLTYSTHVNKRQGSCQSATVVPLMDLFQMTE